MRAALEKAQRIWSGRQRLLAGLSGATGQTLAEYGIVVTLIAVARLSRLPDGAVRRV